MRFRGRFGAAVGALPLAWAVAGLALAGALWPAAARPDGAGDVYRVSAISVDVTAKDAASAREAALREGQRTGLERLLRRIVAEEDLARVPALSDAQTAELISDFSVTNERASSVRYLADLIVRFNPNAIRQLLRRSSARYAETRSKPVVVLAIFGPVEEPRL